MKVAQPHANVYFDLDKALFKAIYLSKALTCMNFFLYKQKCFFIKEKDTFGHIVE